MSSRKNRIRDGVAVPAITPTSKRNSPERQLAHKARMEGKRFDRERRQGEKPRITKMSRTEIRRRFGLGMQLNRHTHAPHEHAREIARNQRKALAS